MKKIAGILLMVVMVLLLLSSCGVPQENYDAAVTERDAAQSQVASLQNDLSKAKSELSAVNANVASLQEDCDAVESDLTAAQSAKSAAESARSAAERELSSVQSDLAAAEAKITELEAAAALAKEEVAEEKQASKLELLWSRAWYGGVDIFSGEVKNISDATLEDVEAVLLLYTPERKLIQTETALIWENPLLPGQTSKFEFKYNADPEWEQEGATYGIYFRFQSGEIILWKFAPDFTGS